MKISEITQAIEAFAPLSLQEDYDNAGIQVGNLNDEITGVLLCTDVREEIIDEAIERGANLIISHHPLIFHGLKKIAGNSYIERIVARAIKNDITIYAAHTNMDSAQGGVNFKIAQKLWLNNVQVLDPQPQQPGYEGTSGLGVIGDIPSTPAMQFLQHVKDTFEVSTLRYCGDTNRTVSRIALCGGAGAFLVKKAVELEADLFITADMKYHDFFGLENRIIIADIGHYESEHFTKEIFYEIITKKNPTFAVDFAKNEKNQIKYL